MARVIAHNISKENAPGQRVEFQAYRRNLIAKDLLCV